MTEKVWYVLCFQTSLLLLLARGEEQHVLQNVLSRVTCCYVPRVTCCRWVVLLPNAGQGRGAAPGAVLAVAGLPARPGRRGPGPRVTPVSRVQHVASLARHVASVHQYHSLRGARRAPGRRVRKGRLWGGNTSNSRVQISLPCVKYFLASSNYFLIPVTEASCKEGKLFLILDM